MSHRSDFRSAGIWSAVLKIHGRLCENPANSFPRHFTNFPCQAAFHTYSGIDTGLQFVVESAMTILQRTGRYILFLSVFILLLQVTAVTAENRKDGVTVSYESSGTSRVARFKNSNSYHVRVEFSYSGTKVHGSAETSGQGAVFVPANYSAMYGGHGISVTSVRITRVMRSD
jgi:hypothetical protein